MDDINGQLLQMKLLLQHAPEDEKPGIQLIIDQLEELLGTSNPTPPSSSISQSQGVEESQADNEEDDEYKQFQAEIAALNSEQQSNEKDEEAAPEESTKEPDSIGTELEALIGMKCMAPHQENWGQIGYYSAMVSSVLSLEKGEEDKPDDISSIMVRVIFLQPVVKSQLLCPFFKEDRCKFSENDCKFSHGEVVPLSHLREYSEPDYSSIIPGSRVLAKYHDDLWYKATVQRITDDGECEISYDVGNEALVIPLHETTPLNDEQSSDSDLSEEDDIENPQISSDSDDEFPKHLMDSNALLDIKGNSALGIWEQYTKGIGSKLMMQMGYVMGTGLGRNREGRVEPVDAIVLPPGKSLDACMALKEKAKDGDLFSAEKRRLKLQRKADKQRAKLAAQKPKEEANVFEFLNSKLALRKTSSELPKKDDIELRKQSSSNLNKKMFGVNENLRQVNKDIGKTKESMKRHKGKDKETYLLMERKLEALESKRRELDSQQNTIAKEQKSRLDKRKLDLF